jgi:hypothetical protein
MTLPIGATDGPEATIAMAQATSWFRGRFADEGSLIGITAAPILDQGISKNRRATFARRSWPHDAARFCGFHLTA